MKRLVSNVACIVTFGSTVTPAVSAQSPAEQVEQAIIALYEAINDGDAAGFWSHMVTEDPGHAGSFPRNGIMLSPPADPEPEMQANFDRGGVAFDVDVRDIHVTVYGNTAVATYYTTGTSRVPGQEASVTGTFRVSNVWIRQGGSWKQAHSHLSPLVS